jgi:uncharacterized protein
MMRPSCYLNAVEIGEGSSLLYNGLSMRIDVVPSEIAHRLVSSAGKGDLPFLQPAEKEHLAQRGHLTRLTARGEQEAMRKLARALARREAGLNRQPSSGRMLSFILTYRCNLSCSYCFQNDVREASRLSSTMSEAFVDDFFRRYLDTLFPDTPKDRLRFILFGGEPLLPGNRGTLERILRYAQEHGIVVSTATNGVLLPKMLDLIGPGKIQGVQVTLDGERMFHDQTRVTPSGAPTFDASVDAIRHVMKAGATAFVRIHLHPGRLETARKLVEYLEREGILGHDRVETYFAPVHSFHAEDISQPDYDVFSRLFQHVALRQKKLPIQNFDCLEGILDVQAITDWSPPRYCAVSAGVHCAVDSRGDLYECLEEAGDRERRIGALLGGKIEYFKLRDAYKKRHLENRPECLRCSIALFCGGGCISQKRTHGGSLTRPFCLQNKVFVGQTLKACYLQRQAATAGAGGRPSRKAQ